MEKTKIQGQLLPVYDYIVVGAGTSGCVIASRLSEECSKTVLILEAGCDDREFPDIAIPAREASMQMTEYDWEYKTVPQKNAFKGYKKQVCNVPRGKVLGGTGCLNYMMYMRGTPHDYDTWENMGCPGWSYKDVLPYFIKSESCLVSKLVESGYHGSSGPMMVTEASGFSRNIADTFVKAGKELGYCETDCNGENPLGFMFAQANIGDGIRQSSSEAFLRQASARVNLHIATHCHVTKILIDNGVARAVRFARGGRTETVRARREIVISAGAIGSPQLLMLSGIGPKEHLESLKIPVIADLPVGENLQDHICTFGIEFDIDEPWSATPDVMTSQETRSRYDDMRSGPLASNLAPATALVRSELQASDNPNPDLQIIQWDLQIGADKDTPLRKNINMTDEMWGAVMAGKDGRHGFSLYPIVAHPKSRGTIRLNSDDPFHHPIIDHQTMSHPDDAKILVQGVKLAMQVAQTKAYRSIGARFSGGVLPGYKGAPFTDQYWEELVRTLTFNIYHVSGTCRMGQISDPTTVLDPQLRVKGIGNMRVADASIMPEIISANLNASCVMIGEKAADLIKGKTLTSNL